MIVIVGRGYIGTALFRCLHDYGRDVVTIGRDDSFEILSTLTPKDVVINCAGAGMKPVKPSKDAYLAENVLLPVKLAKFTAWRDIKFIHLGSYFEFFQSNIYSKTKGLASEMLFRKPNVSLVYCYNVFGGVEYPNRFYAGIKNSILSNTPFTLTTPEACRSMVHIDHVVNAINEIIDKPVGNFQLTDGQFERMRHIVNDIKYSAYKDLEIIIKEQEFYNKGIITCAKPYFKKLDFIEDVKRDVEASR